MEILSARGTKTVQFRKDWTRESVIEGEIEVCPDTEPIVDPNFAGIAKLMGMPPTYFDVPVGFVRESSTFKVNTEGTRLEFKFVDAEQKPPTIEDDPKPIIVE